MHYDLSPDVSFLDAQKSFMALAGYYQGGDKRPDVGCTVKAASLIVAHGSTYLPHDMHGAQDIGDDAAKAKVLLEAANSQAAGDGMKAINWFLLIQIALSALSVLIPLVRK